jgi:hypothetical protein
MELKKVRLKYVRETEWDKCLKFPAKNFSRREIDKRARGSLWFTGGELGSEYGFRCRTDGEKALRRLKRSFGSPNSVFSTGARRFPKEHKKFSWEYLFWVYGEHWYSVYEVDGKVYIGYRFLVKDDVGSPGRKDFRATNRLNSRFCKFIRSIIEAEEERRVRKVLWFI